MSKEFDLKKSAGFAPIYRSLADHAIWHGEPFTRGQAWADLLMLVNYKDGQIMIDGTMIEVKKGQHVTSVMKLAERWRWSRAKVLRYFKMLKTEQMLDWASDNKKTVITLLNHDFWNSVCDNENTEKQASETLTNTERTSDGHQTDIRRTSDGHQTDTNNKDNKDNNTNKEKKDKKNTADANASKTLNNDRFEEFWGVYNKKVSKTTAKKAWDKIKMTDALFEEIMIAIRNQLKYDQWESKQYQPYASRWLNEKRWEDEIIPSKEKSKNQSNWKGNGNQGHTIASSVAAMNIDQSNRPEITIESSKADWARYQKEKEERRIAAQKWMAEQEAKKQEAANVK